MGTCQNSSVVEINSNNSRRPEAYSNIKNGIVNGVTATGDPNFPNMKEWPGKRYKGIGIKKMKGYICSLPIDELNLKRNEFWHAKCSLSNTWLYIQQACIYDEYHSNLVLEKHGLKTANGCINHIIDRHNNHYFIPNYCINDPYFEKKLNTENDEEKTLNLVLFESSENCNVAIEISNLATGLDLIHEFASKAKINLSSFNLRLFFSGVEIKEDHLLFQHNLNNEYKIQVMKIAKPKE